MIGIGSKMKSPTTGKTLEVVVDAVARHGRLKNFLQRTACINQKERPLAHNFNQLAGNVSVLTDRTDVESLRKAIALWAIHYT